MGLDHFLLFGDNPLQLGDFWHPHVGDGSGSDSNDARGYFRLTPNSGHFLQRADLAFSNVGLWSNSGRNPRPPELLFLAEAVEELGGLQK